MSSLDLVPRNPEVYSLADVEGWGKRLVAWSDEATLDEAQEVLKRAQALERYLGRRELAGPMQTAERYLERRIGQLLGPGEHGGDRRSDQAPRVADEIEEHSRRRFRLIAAHWDAITPNLPCSRAKALRIAEIARQQAERVAYGTEETPPPEGWYTRAEWAEASEQERTAALAVQGAATFNMQDTDNVEWARWTWNPVTGCEHNCPYCYARDIAMRFYPTEFVPTFYPERLTAPANTPMPDRAADDIGWRNVFVCSMADLFGRWVPEVWIHAVLAQVTANPQWTFLFLTKFPNRLAEFNPFPPNAWVGTSVDCQARVANAEQSFRRVDASVKWLSVEPMLEKLHFTDLAAFDWLVMGGASGSTQTPAWHPARDWSEDLRRAAEAAGCMVYEKTNLLERIRDYPGRHRGDARQLPKALAYIPSIGSEPT